MWRLTEHAWAIAVTVAGTTALWVYGPVSWVTRQDTELTAANFYAWARAGWDYKHLLPLAFAPLVTLICLALCRHFWPRIRAYENVVVKEIFEQNKVLQADLISQKAVLDSAARAHEELVEDLQRRETDFQATMEKSWASLDSREAAIKTARAKADELDGILNAREKEFASREKAVEVKEAELSRREQNLPALEKQLAERKTSIQAQAAEAQVILLRAEADAIEVLERAEQEARDMVLQARAQCTDLWSWCHFKAAGAEVTPDEWRQVKRLRQEILERKQAGIDQPEDDSSPPEDTDDQRQVVIKGLIELSDRKAMALNYSREHGSLTIQDFERICPGVNRRTLQRDLRDMVDGGILITMGASNQFTYHLAKSYDMNTAKLRHG